MQNSLYYFHSLKSLFDVLQVVDVICKYLNNILREAWENQRRSRSQS